MPTVMDIYKTLYTHFGPQHWWPAESRFEIIVGAILTQQASWKNVERSIDNLKKQKMLDARKIASARAENIEELVRPSGFYRQKARYLMAFCKYLVDKYDASLDTVFSKELEELREEILAQRGIGPETCDSILLYAGNKLSFVVDAYTLRVCQRTELFKSKKYEEVKRFFEDNTEPDVQVYNEFHALFVALGKNYCKSRNPDCANCPLMEMCKYDRSAV